MSNKTHHEAQSIRTVVRQVRAWFKRHASPVSIDERVAFLSHAVDRCDLEWRIREVERCHVHAGFSHEANWSVLARIDADRQARWSAVARIDADRPFARL